MLHSNIVYVNITLYKICIAYIKLYEIMVGVWEAVLGVLQHLGMAASIGSMIVSMIKFHSDFGNAEKKSLELINVFHEGVIS